MRPSVPRLLGPLLLLALALAAPMRASRIEHLKPLYPATPLVVDGVARAVIVRPASPEWAAAAAQVQAALAQRSGVQLPVLTDAEVVDSRRHLDLAALGGRQVIALGNMGRNRLLGVLWTGDYLFEDDAFPGAGGWVVRSIHDPFANGTNVIELGASTPSAVLAAADQLLAHVTTGSTTALAAPLLLVQRGAAPDPYAGAAGAPKVKENYRFPPPAEFAANLDARVAAVRSHDQDETKARIPTLVSVTTVLSQLAEAWAFTGDPGYPPLMKRLVDTHRDLLAVIPDRVEMEPASAAAMPWWDLIEELPVWTDDDRLLMANAILRDALQGHEHTEAHELVKQGFKQVLTENHGTNSALNTFGHWRYFAKYYDLPEEPYWTSVVQAIFAGQLASFQVLEDSSLYTPFAPEDAMQYGLQSGDTRYFDLGIAQTQIEFIMTACISNLGLSSGFGDARFIQFPWSWRPAALEGWFGRDPVATWWWRHYLPLECGIGTFDRGTPLDDTIPLREPTEWTGLTVFPIYQQVLGEAKSSRTVVTSPKAPVADAWFNKLIFRDRWSPDAQYLLLDGAGVFAGDAQRGEPPGPKGHNHNDVNSITTFTAERRMWLVDHTYALRAVQDHNGLTITRDGELSYFNHLAKLENHASNGRFALTRTTFGDYSGATWERTIFWRRGDHFVVLDRAIADQAGDFTVRCAWRGLGEHRLQGGELRLEQDGKFGQVRSDGTASLGVEEMLFPDAGGWSVYPYAKPIAKIFDQLHAATLQPGEAIAFGNLLKASASAAALDATALRRLDDRTLWVRDGAHTAIYGVGPVAALDADCAVHLLADDGLLLSGVTHAFHGQFQASGPVDLAVAADGTVTVSLRSDGVVTLQGRDLALTAGDQVLAGAAAWGRTLLAGAAQRLAAMDHPPAAAAKAPAAAGATSTATAAAVWSFHTDVRRARPVVLAPGEAPTWLVAGQAGLSAFAADGTLRWRFNPGAGCDAFDAVDTDGDGRVEIVVGADDEKVYGLDAAGAQRWSFTCQSAIAGGPPVPDDIRIADLAGDGHWEVVVAANFIHLLRPDGSLIWEDYWRFQRNRRVGDVQSIDLVDIDGDGRRDIVAGIRLNYSVAVAWNAEGQRVYPADPTGQPNHKPLRIDLPNDTLVTNLFADGGPPQIIVAATDKLNLRWIGGDRDTKRAGDFDGGRVALARVERAGQRPLLVSASDLGALFAYRAAGERADGLELKLETVWRRILGDKITVLAAEADGARLLVGTRGGAAYVIAGDSGAVRVQGRISTLPVRALATQAGRLLVVAEDGQVGALALP